MRKHIVQHPEFEREVFDFWRACYFTNPYLAYDQAFPLAVEFVQACRDLGTDLVYLTGRDEPGMGQGTRQGLRDLGFPFDEDGVHLLLKPTPEQSDVDYKKDALGKIDQLGYVIAAFENEMRNLNMIAEHYPDALMIYRQTLQSPNPPEAHPRIVRHHRFMI
ncbi:MAG: HAD family acid phosphatase [Oligoflexus sp.]